MTMLKRIFPSRIRVAAPIFAASICAALSMAGPFALAQAGSEAAHQLSPQAEPSQPIDAYIHAAWDTLSRSMSDCNSVADPKLATTPILYLPADVPEPPEIAALEKTCKVKVDRLPRRIEHIGDIRPSEIAHAGLL